ncbi:MAG TPA: alpha/beta fold hydrolase [Solirubrobacterales bacterium]|nr:alpha/beta fold hydrolase [Solirubrobacterales bacterium]
MAAAAALALLALAAGAAAAWHFSSAVLVPDHSPWPAETRVEAMPPGRIVLESGDRSERPGVYGLEWLGGRAIVGPVLSEDDEEGTVTRRLRSVDGYLVPGMEVAFDSNVWAGDPTGALGLPSATVPIRGELGAMPAWLVPGRERTWAIFVHGINGTPQSGLRVVPTLHRAGLPTMLITYREDRGAPPSPDGFHHMGLTEWRDLEAAARYAIDRGARRLVLIGYSMGGAIVTQFMQRSPLAERAAGLVLDAPVLDWQEVIAFNATEMGFPSIAALPVEWAIGARIDADWESLDAVQHPEDLQLPILLFHGTEDEVVPISTSDELAAEMPGRVTYFRVPEAGHTEGWNVAPSLYGRRLGAFIAGLSP